MHPGNIFIDINEISEPRYIFVDFGIIGTLSENDQRYLAENLLAFFEQDYRKVALLHLQSGWVPPNTSLSHFEFSIRGVCEPIFQRPLKDISVGETFLKLIKVAQEHKIVIQPQLILLQKTLLAVEGLSRRLYPELDLWTAIYPYVKNAVRIKFGLVGELRKTWARLPVLLEKFNQDHSLETLNKLEKRHQYSAWLFIDGLYWISILFNTSLYISGFYHTFQEYIMMIILHVVLKFIIKNRYKEI
jgi:ubiquinone biosynthesis protein